MFNNLFPKAAPLYEIMWKNTVDQAGHRKYTAFALRGG
jgi:hypothetical protein